LRHVRDQRVGTFFGGMRQRLGVAAALLGKSNADPSSTNRQPGRDAEERVRLARARVS
jgi:hypothetical protein